MRVTQWDRSWPLRRFAVTGGRDFDDEDMMIAALSRLPAWSVLVNGGAKGADQLAVVYWRILMRDWRSTVYPMVAKPEGYIETHPADWAQHGKAAGAIRNQQMLKTGIDMLLAFPGGRGTAHMTSICERAGVPIVEAAWLVAERSPLVSDVEPYSAVPPWWCVAADRCQTLVDYVAIEPLELPRSRTSYVIQEPP